MKARPRLRRAEGSVGFTTPAEEARPLTAKTRRRSSNSSRRASNCRATLATRRCRRNTSMGGRGGAVAEWSFGGEVRGGA